MKKALPAAGDPRPTAFPAKKRRSATEPQPPRLLTAFRRGVGSGEKDAHQHQENQAGRGNRRDPEPRKSSQQRPLHALGKQETTSKLTRNKTGAPRRKSVVPLARQTHPEKPRRLSASCGEEAIVVDEEWHSCEDHAKKKFDKFLSRLEEESNDPGELGTQRPSEPLSQMAAVANDSVKVTGAENLRESQKVAFQSARCSCHRAESTTMTSSRDDIKRDLETERMLIELEKMRIEELKLRAYRQKLEEEARRRTSSPFADS